MRCSGSVSIWVWILASNSGDRARYCTTAMSKKRVSVGNGFRQHRRISIALDAQQAWPHVPTPRSVSRASPQSSALATWPLIASSTNQALRLVFGSLRVDE